jgi:hypothetical protein
VVPPLSTVTAMSHAHRPAIRRRRALAVLIAGVAGTAVLAFPTADTGSTTAAAPAHARLDAVVEPLRDLWYR